MAIIVAISMPVFVGFMGMALDVGYYYHHRRIMQTAADAGALAGANEIFRSRQDLVPSSARNETARNGLTDGSASVVVTVNNPPASGYYTGNPQYVEVLIAQDVPSLVIRLLGFQSWQVPARAVAGVRTKSRNCVHSLHPTAEKAFSVTSNSTLQATNCNIVDNSTAYNAYNVESGSVIATNGGESFVTGDANITGSSVTPEPQTEVPPTPDPLANMDFPSYGSCNYTNFKVSSGTFVIDPGVYCGGIEIASGATATFNAGNYILVDGGLQVDSGSTVSGSGVTFFNTSTGTGENYQPIRIKSGSSASFSAPTTGDYANILFFQDPDAGKAGDTYENEISSNILGEFTGVMYFPTQTLKLAASNSTVNVSGAVIASIIDVSSTSTVNINYDLLGTSPLKRLSLVE